MKFVPNLVRNKGKFSKAQLRAWAHMTNMGKYESYDEASNSLHHLSVFHQKIGIRSESVEAVACITGVWNCLPKYDNDRHE
jgi:hypothetical protein